MKQIFQMLLIFSLSSLTILSCKSVKSPKYITHTETLSDTLIRHEVESIVLPQRNVVVIENPCKENTLSLLNQTIENDYSTLSVTSENNTLHIEVDIDSIVNSRLSEVSTKSEVESIEIPIEVPYPVKNKLNLYMVLYSIGATILLFRKPIWFLIRKLIMPI